MTDRAQLKLEPLQNVFATQRVRFAEYRLASVGAVYAGDDADGVHDPHQASPGVEPVAHLREHLAPAGARRD